MKFLTLMQKKFRRRWTDVQVMILLKIASEPSSVDEIMTTTGATYNGVWNSLQMLIQVDKFVSVVPNSRPLRYRLTSAGESELAKFLTDGRP